MYPVLLKLGPLTLYTYGLALVVAFTLVTWLAAKTAHGLPPQHVAVFPDQLVDFSGWSLLGGLVGARVFYVLLHWDWFVSSPQDILAIWHGGLVWYGGFLGGLVAGWLYLRAKRLVFLRVVDQFIPFVALGHAVGRIGCFLNGCCYGKPTSSWYGVVFPGQDIPVLPTQLVEALGLLFLYILLRTLQRPTLLRRPGWIFSCYLIAYGLLRFLMEFLRGDQTTCWLGLTLQQLISIGTFVVGLFLMNSSLRKSINL